MASTESFVEYVKEQLQGVGEIRYRKMFGEYGMYCNDKYFAMICDDRFLVKITDAGKEYLKDYKIELPYAGAKPAFLITELDNKEMLHTLTKITCEHLPMPKPKKKKSTTK